MWNFMSDNKWHYFSDNKSRCIQYNFKMLNLDKKAESLSFPSKNKQEYCPICIDHLNGDTFQYLSMHFGKIENRIIDDREFLDGPHKDMVVESD